MAMKAACTSFFKFNLDYLFKLNQCLTTRNGFSRGFFTSSSKRDEFSRPKKPPNSYILFANAEREKLKKENPDVATNEIHKMLSKRWAMAEDSEKKKYQIEYQKLRDAYEEQLKYFIENATEEQLEIPPKKEKKSDAWNEKRLKKKELEKLDKPKISRSALNFYTKEVCSGPDGVAFIEVAKKFNELSPEEKEPYLRKSKLDKIRYEEEMEDWEEKMWEIGRTDLIRQKSKNKR